MHNKTNIILTGFMGTGKTTIGRLLAAQLKYDFVDTDEWIEERAGRSVADIFAIDGEAAFRQLERDAAQELAGRSGVVIATGGRLMLDPDNARVLGQSGHVFCLTATAHEIFHRVTSDHEAAERPLLQGGDPLERIQTLLNERAAQYGRFPQIVTSGRSAVEVVRQIVGELLDSERS